MLKTLKENTEKVKKTMYGQDANSNNNKENLGRNQNENL